MSEKQDQYDIRITRLTKDLARELEQTQSSNLLNNITPDTQIFTRDGKPVDYEMEGVTKKINNAKLQIDGGFGREELSSYLVPIYFESNYDQEAKFNAEGFVLFDSLIKMMRGNNL